MTLFPLLQKHPSSWLTSGSPSSVPTFGLFGNGQEFSELKRLLLFSVREDNLISLLLTLVARKMPGLWSQLSALWDPAHPPMWLHPLWVQPPHSLLQSERSGTQGAWGRWDVPGLFQPMAIFEPQGRRRAGLLFLPPLWLLICGVVCSRIALVTQRLKRCWDRPGAANTLSALSQHPPCEAALRNFPIFFMGRKDAPLSAPPASLFPGAFPRSIGFSSLSFLVPFPTMLYFSIPSLKEGTYIVEPEVRKNGETESQPCNVP